MLPIFDQRGILGQVEAGEHFLVGDARLAVGEVRALEAEADRVRGQRLGLLQPGEASPRGRRSAGSARRSPGDRPTAACASPRCGRAAPRPGRARSATASGTCSFFTSASAAASAGLRARARGGGEEVERGDALELAPLLVHHARDRARVGLAEADAQALDRLDQVLVARRAVEQALELLLLVRACWRRRAARARCRRS